jgi:hypothetical protein
MSITDSSTVDIGGSDKLSVFINSIVGAGVENSNMRFKISYDYNKKVFICHNNSDNIWSDNSYVIFSGAYISHSYYGVGVRASIVSNYYSTGDDLTNKPRVTITNCFVGITAYNNSNLRLRNIVVSFCSSAGISCTDSVFIIGAYPSDLTNNKSSIVLDSCSSAISKCTIVGLSTTGVGIYAVSTNIRIYGCDIDSCYDGIYVRHGTYLYMSNVSSTNNDRFGVLMYYKSKGIITNNSNSNISGNSSYDIYSSWSSHVNIYTDNAISNMHPSPNTQPSWSGTNAGSYIGYTEY